MGLNKYCLGELLELLENNNSDLKFDASHVRGVNNLKKLMPTKVDVSDRDLSKFQIVRPGEFVFNHRTSRNGSKFSIAYNDGTSPIICTEDYVVFRVRPDCTSILMAEWLYMYFNRSEFDRYVITNSWGSSTEFYNWEDICSIILELPDLPTQEKYVAIYKAMQANQRSYERGLEDLKLVCDGYIETIRHSIPSVKLGPYIEVCKERNVGNDITLFQGVNVDHVFTEPKRIAENAENGCVVRAGQFAFNKVMKSHNTKLPFALREGPDCVVSSSYQVFKIKDTQKLLPKYLLVWMNRSETQRYAGFISFGTTRDIFTFDDMKEICMPIPDNIVQQRIVDIFSIYQIRKELNERLKSQLSAICPILIRGSLSDGG